MEQCPTPLLSPVTTPRGCSTLLPLQGHQDLSHCPFPGVPHLRSRPRCPRGSAGCRAAPRRAACTSCGSRTAGRSSSWRSSPGSWTASWGQRDSAVTLAATAWSSPERGAVTREGTAVSPASALALQEPQVLPFPRDLGSWGAGMGQCPWVRGDTATGRAAAHPREEEEGSMSQQGTGIQHRDKGIHGRAIASRAWAQGCSQCCRTMSPSHPALQNRVPEPPRPPEPLLGHLLRQGTNSQLPG